MSWDSLTDNLTDKQRAAWDLHSEGYSTGEIAFLHSVTPGAIKRRLARVRIEIEKERAWQERVSRNGGK